MIIVTRMVTVVLRRKLYWIILIHTPSNVTMITLTLLLVLTIIPILLIPLQSTRTSMSSETRLRSRVYYIAHRSIRLLAHINMNTKMVNLVLTVRRCYSILSLSMEISKLVHIVVMLMRTVEERFITLIIITSKRKQES
jgi:hypothetical protein